MRTFEISNKKDKNGRRHFKLVLHEIYPDSCIDEANECGTIYNDNGITWIREYCERQIDYIKNMSLRVEFLDEERVEIFGHGLTEIKDGFTLFENATVIGHFTKGYITEIEDDGKTKTVLIGEGYIDEMCYPKFVEKLEQEIALGQAPFGSVEIYKSEGNDGIVYKYGYKDFGRIPMDYIYSGYALLGVMPSDQTAKLLELNNKEDSHTMNEEQVKSIIVSVLAEMSNHTAEINACKTECDTKVAEANELVEAANTEKENAIANAAEVQTALNDAKDELKKAYENVDALHDEISALRDKLAKVNAEKRISELNSAIADFSDEEKGYAQAEIDAFNADPVNVEINSVVSKIYEGIGINAKKVAEEEAAHIAEQNSANTNIEDIFATVDSKESVDETDIF